MNAADPRHILILGGGTAGWISAALIAHQWPSDRVLVTVVESPDIGIIGVGEGSTPQLPALMQRLGIADADWMPACNATYKAGIRFRGWSDKPGYPSYFHPFATALDGHTLPNFFHNSRLRRSGFDAPAHPDLFTLSSRIAERGLAPLPAENFPFDTGYGYHFDATLLGRFLRDHAVQQLGVTHRSATVADATRHPSGDLAALVLSDGERIDGDLFVDASGFRALLIEQQLGERFISFADNLFNDRAVALPTPRSDGPLHAETVSTALSAGWAWRIPLTNRTGNGYVYSSAHLSADAAEAELRQHLGAAAAGAEARHLDMRVGRMANSWVRNCLAVGLSQGFIEPLEATALHIVQATVEAWIAALEADQFGDGERDSFNRQINARYDGIRDYIVCHFKANQRADNDYWRANANNPALSDSLKSILTCWYTGGDLAQEVDRQGIGKYYAALSWHCLLAGYGVFPADEKLKPLGASPVSGGVADCSEIGKFLDRCALNYPDHAGWLAQQAKAAGIETVTASRGVQ